MTDTDQTVESAIGPEVHTLLSWRTFYVKIEFEDRLVGGVPATLSSDDREAREKAYQEWVAQQTGEDAPESLVNELAEDPDMPVVEIGPLNAFKRDEDGIYVEARQVKAMLKEAAQRLGIVVRQRGARQVLQHDLHVRDDLDQRTQKLHPYPSKKDADGIDERPISVMTRQGPRTAIKRFEYLEQVQIAFHVKVLKGGVGDNKVTAANLAQMLELGGWLGLGADRSQGAGLFNVVEFYEVD